MNLPASDATTRRFRRLFFVLPADNCVPFSIFAVRLKNRDVAQPGSALRSGRRGRWFESSHPDHVGTSYFIQNGSFFIYWPAVGVS